MSHINKDKSAHEEEADASEEMYFEIVLQARFDSAAKSIFIDSMWFA